MIAHCSTYYSFLTVFLFAAVYAEQMGSPEDLVVPKGSWDVMRIGRGLQMLRMGKRSSESSKDGSSSSSGSGSPGVGGFSLSDGELQRLVEYVRGEMARDTTRRQPPLPRYGRDMISRREIMDLLDSLSNRSYMRPAPRGGRYRRSTGGSRLGGPFSEDGNRFSRVRSVVKPRIGRFIQGLHLQTKAISRPRIGRQPKIFSVEDDDQATGRMLEIY